MCKNWFFKLLYHFLFLKFKPGIAYMEACRIFNPRNCGNCQKIQCNFPQYLLYTWCHELIEFDWYMNILGPHKSGSRQYYVLEKYSKSRPCISWRSQARVCSVLNSADAERSNSGVYSIVFYERRWSLVPKTLKQLVFIYYNHMTCGVLDQQWTLRVLHWAIVWLSFFKESIECNSNKPILFCGSMF